MTSTSSSAEGRKAGSRLESIASEDEENDLAEERGPGDLVAISMSSPSNAFDANRLRDRVKRLVQREREARSGSGQSSQDDNVQQQLQSDQRVLQEKLEYEREQLKQLRSMHQSQIDKYQQQLKKAHQDKSQADANARSESLRLLQLQRELEHLQQDQQDAIQEAVQNAIQETTRKLAMQNQAPQDQYSKFNSSCASLDSVDTDAASVLSTSTTNTTSTNIQAIRNRRSQMESKLRQSISRRQNSLQKHDKEHIRSLSNLTRDDSGNPETANDDDQHKIKQLEQALQQALLENQRLKQTSSEPNSSDVQLLVSKCQQYKLQVERLQTDLRSRKEAQHQEAIQLHASKTELAMLRDELQRVQDLLAQEQERTLQLQQQVDHLTNQQQQQEQEQQEQHRRIQALQAQNSVRSLGASSILSMDSVDLSGSLNMNQSFQRPRPTHDATKMGTTTMPLDDDSIFGSDDLEESKQEYQQSPRSIVDLNQKLDISKMVASADHPSQVQSTHILQNPQIWGDFRKWLAHGGQVSNLGVLVLMNKFLEEHPTTTTTDPATSASPVVSTH